MTHTDATTTAVSRRWHTLAGFMSLGLMAMLLAGCNVPHNESVWLSFNNSTWGCKSMDDCQELTDESWAHDYYRSIGAEDDYGTPLFTFEQWKQQFGYYDSTPVRAVYGNRLDLQLGRDMNCWEQSGTRRVICYVTNYGAAAFVDGEESFLWPQLAKGTIEAGEGDIHKSLATVAMVYDPRYSFEPVTYYVFGPSDSEGNQRLIPSVALDGEGPKTVPGMCQGCHRGGTLRDGKHFDSFLPFDVQSFYFAPFKDSSNMEPSPYRFDNQQEAFRQLNALVLKASHSPAIENVVNGWYGGDVNTPGGTIPDDTYIPPGWDVDRISRNMYRHVYRPYCRTCHVAQRGAMAFEKISDLDPQQVVTQVCGRSMPNAEVPYGSIAVGGTYDSRFGPGQGLWVDEVAKTDVRAYLDAHGIDGKGCFQ